MTSISRRFVGLAGASAIAVAALAAGPGPAGAQETLKVAVIAPLSGPWARQGQLIQMGAEMAVDEINELGGIKSMGGAKLELVSADAGDSPEKAKNAAQRLIAQEPDLVGGTGAWLSSFTLAVTEVTERAKVPWLTLSYADSLTERDFDYIFQTSLPASQQSANSLPTIVELAKKATGGIPKTVGIIGDNTASPVAFLKPMREGGMEEMGIEVVMDETYTPPLSDATPLIQKVRSSRPEFLLFISSTISDLKLGLEKLNEFGIDVPVIGNGAHMGAPEVVNNVSPDLLEGVMFIAADWGLKGHEEIIEKFKERTGEPWITQDAITAYGDMWIIKEALEKVGSADTEAIAKAIHEMTITEGPAATAFPGEVAFDEAGRRTGGQLVIVQWQDGVPVSVFPTESAFGEPRWPQN
ncbi:ABC transporter substrate-binding protein [Microbaculum marinum]|uniref:ABC transporter substrate-binding protein n=1 Tax=Microbaculum marinum TaxID=1764581 RepID=A0AAW9RWJ7_9HYPH